MDKLVKLFFVFVTLALLAGNAVAEEKAWSWTTLNALPTGQVAPYVKGQPIGLCNAFGRKPGCWVVVPDKLPPEVAAYGCYSVVAVGKDGKPYLWGDMYAIQEAYKAIYQVADVAGQQVCGRTISGPEHPALVRIQ